MLIDDSEFVTEFFGSWRNTTLGRISLVSGEMRMLKIVKTGLHAVPVGLNEESV